MCRARRVGGRGVCGYLEDEKKDKKEGPPIIQTETKGPGHTLHHLALSHCTLMTPLPVPALIAVAGVAAVLLVVIVAKKCLCKTSSGDGDRGDIEMDGGMSTKIRHEVRSPFG